MLACALAAVIGCGWAYEAEAAARAEIGQITVNQKGSDFRYWNKDAASYQALTDYIRDITNKKSKNFIPVEDRIAVFDMDGTILCETAPYYLSQMLILERTLHDSNYKPAEADKAFAQGLERWLNDKSASKPGSSTPHFAAIFAGMTDAEFRAYVENFMEKPVEGLSNMTWGEAFYLPMVEIIKYLQANQFQVYIVSGSERKLVRILVADLLKIPAANIIGSDMETLAAHQGGTDGLKYVYRKDDYLVRGGKLQVKNLQLNKTTAIAREIGKQPVLAFGNSKDDASMLNYAISGNKHKSAAFFVICDDLQRELGDEDKAEKCRKLAADNGWQAISMQHDFKTIYGDDVKRTAR